MPPALVGLVESIVGYDHRLPADAVHHGLPSPTLTVILAFDEPLDCGWADGRSRGRYWRLAGGLHTAPAQVHTHGHQHGVQLALTPLGARVLLGVPAAVLSEDIADHDDLPGGVPRGLHDRLQDASWPARFALLDEHLCRTVARSEYHHLAPELACAWRQLNGRGDTRVTDVAGEVGWSRRHLTGRFRAEFGLSPKEVSRVARFDRARRLLLAGRSPGEVAAICGYADQPHLNREWRALGGLTPTQLAQNFPIVQDEPGGPAAR